jgi:hypothetical protein
VCAVDSLSGILKDCRSADSSIGYSTIYSLSFVKNRVLIPVKETNQIIECKISEDGTFDECKSADVPIQKPQTIAIHGNFAYISSGDHSKITIMRCTIGPDSQLNNCENIEPTSSPEEDYFSQQFYLATSEF